VVLSLEFLGAVVHDVMRGHRDGGTRGAKLAPRWVCSALGPFQNVWLDVSWQIGGFSWPTATCYQEYMRCGQGGFHPVGSGAFPPAEVGG
jgi:hypothetical protein